MEGIEKASQEFCLAFVSTMSINQFKYLKLCSVAFGHSQMSMDFIAVDLIGPFEVTNQRNLYVLTVMRMLLIYLMCISLLDITNAYLQEVSCHCCDSYKILTDNGGEFKNKNKVCFWGNITIRDKTYIFFTV